MPSDPSKAVILWVPPDQRPEVQAERARKAKELEARDAATDARLAKARDAELHAKLMTRSREFVLSQIDKWAALAADPDYAKSIGPIEPAILLKLLELAAKDWRLSTGQATENLAHVVVTSADFGKLSQEERDRWRELAIKAGVPEE